MAQSLTPDEIHTARLMRREGKTIEQIALQLGPQPHGDRRSVPGLRALRQPDASRQRSRSVLAERDARLALLPRDLTAAIAGDPLPGHECVGAGGGVATSGAVVMTESKAKLWRLEGGQDETMKSKSREDDMRTGRKRNPNVRRDPTGKSRGAPEVIDPETLAVRARELRAAGFDARFAGKHASDALAGFTLGVLHLRWQACKNDPGGISPEQFNTAQAWTRIVHRHAAIMGYSLTIRTPSFIMVGGGITCLAEPEEQKITSVRREWTRLLQRPDGGGA